MGTMSFIAMSDGSAGEDRGSARSRQLRRNGQVFCISIGVMAVILITWNTSNGPTKSTKFGQTLKAAHPVSVTLTPEIVRTILNLPEADQNALVLKAQSKAQEAAQQHLINIAVTSKLAAGSLPEDSSIFPREYIPLEEEAIVPRTHAQVLATASILFETFHEALTQSVPESLLPGFIGTVAFVFMKFGILGRLSSWFTGEPELLIDEFESLHFMIFVIMVLFISVVLAFLVSASGQEKVWNGYELEWEAIVKKAPGTPSQAKSNGLMNISDEGREISVMDELMRSDADKQAEFLRFRKRFVADRDSGVEISAHFNFAKYLSYCSARTHSILVKISTYDWTMMWSFFAFSYFLAAVSESLYEAFSGGYMLFSLERGACLVMILLQLGTLVATYTTFYTLLKAKKLLMPASRVVLPGGYGTNDFESGDDSIGDPPYLSQMRVVYDDSNTIVARFFSLFGHHQFPNKHQQVFGMWGAHGPYIFLNVIKLAVIINVIILTASFTVLWDELYSISFLLPWCLLAMATMTFILLPQMIFLYTWCCSVELMKHNDIILDVLHRQRHQKVLQIIRSLTMLTYFVDHIEMVSKVAPESNSFERQAISDEQWNHLIKSIKPRDEEELHELFNMFDTDNNGNLDQGEVCALVRNYIGVPLTDEEAENLFNVMDMDGNGTVDFREFASVILHIKRQRAELGQRGLDHLSEKIFNLFDKEGKGQISVQEISGTVSKFGKYWDTEAVEFFFRQVDKDASGSITKAEFTDFLYHLYHEL